MFGKLAATYSFDFTLDSHEPLNPMIMKTSAFFCGAILSVFLFAMALKSNSQTTDYYTIRSIRQAYFDENSQLKAIPGSGYKDFIRWDTYWKSRVGGNNSNYAPGDMVQYTNVLYDYFKNKELFIRETPFAVKWQIMGPPIGTTAVSTLPFSNQVMGKITALYVDKLSDPTGNTIYAGAESSGLWKTTDLGSHWSNVTDNIPLTCGVSDIAGSPTSPGTIFIATGTNAAGIAEYGFGIFKTTDGGNTWSHIYNTGYALTGITRLIVNPYNGNNIFALLFDKVIRTLDGGQTWDTIFGDTATAFHLTQDFLYRNKFLVDIEMKPDDPTIIYISSIGFPNWEPIPNRKWHRAEIWKTSNSMQDHVQWARLDTTGFDNMMVSRRFEISVTPKDPNSVYIIGSDTIEDGNGMKKVRIYKSNDNGLNWNQRYSNDLYLYDDLRLELAVSPTDTNVFYTGGGYAHKFRQVNNQFIPTAISSGHVDTRAMILLNGSSVGTSGANDSLVFGNDGGISFSPNGGASVFNINGDGLCIAQFYGFGWANKNADRLCGGTIDNGIFTDTTGFWFQSPGGGDAGDCIVHPVLKNTMYTNVWGSMGINYGIKRTNDAWKTSKTWAVESSFNNEPSHYNRPIRIDKLHPDTMYAGFRHLYRTINLTDHQGDSARWSPISWNNVDSLIAPIASISAFNYAPEHDSIVFVAFVEPAWSDTAPVKKFFKTTNQWAFRPQWQNLSENPGLQGVLRGFFITDIEISPVNHNVIWISLSGISSSNRVLKSNDGGATWQDYSNGLSKFPVHCIRYKNGSPEGLYIGTDVGVFYTDSTIYNTNGWVPFNKGLPLPIVQDIEINDSLDKIRIATFGRGIWEADLNCGTGENHVTIEEDGFINENIGLDGNLIIERNATLTITGEVAFPPNCKVIVKRGGTLILDGGKLTSRCSQMWLGIELWGNRSLKQTPTTSHNQGMVIMKNGATVENSRIGITTCKKDEEGEVDWDYTGGIIYAQNSRFVNNYKAIEFLSYPYQNISTFSRCKFERNFVVPGTQNNQMSQMVSLLDVNNVRFIGCEFDQTIPFPDNGQPSLSANAYGAAILSYDAGFTLQEYCDQVPCPVTQQIPSSISGFFYGVKAVNSSPDKLIVIKNSRFERNCRGVYLSKSDYPEITKNLFYTPYTYLNNGISSSDTLYGLYLDRCNRFKVQENTFKSNAFVYLNTMRKHVGLVVNNSGADANEIYNNSFDSIKYAIVASNQNRSSDGLTGLCLKCNDFSNTSFDISITSKSIPAPPDHGIAKIQGDTISISAPAGNRFSDNHVNLSGAWDIKNQCNQISYYFHEMFSPLLRIDPTFSSTNVYRHAAIDFTYIKEEACPSKLNGVPPDPEEMKEEIVDTEQESLFISDQLEALVDGGSTEETTEDISFSLPPEAMQLRDELLMKSPYLSDTVMKSAISKEDVLPNEMIRDILVENPQSAKNEEVLQQIENRFIPMPETMLDEIMEGVNIIGAKEDLEAHLSYHNQRQRYLEAELCRFYKTDTVNVSSEDSLITFLRSRNTIESKYQLVFEHIALGETQTAGQVLDSIPQMFSLTDSEFRRYQDYQSYVGIMVDLREQGLPVLEVDSAQRGILLELSIHAEEPVQTFARNALWISGMLTYSEPLLLPDETKSGENFRPRNRISSSSENRMTLFPNPASDYIIVDYKVDQKSGKNRSCVLSILDFRGNVLFENEMKQPENQILVDCRHFIPGEFFCKISNGSETNIVRKFIIVKK